jgi:hypothetical protein
MRNRRVEAPILHSMHQAERLLMSSSRLGFAMEERVMGNLVFERIMGRIIMLHFWSILMDFG